MAGLHFEDFEVGRVFEHPLRPPAFGRPFRPQIFNETVYRDARSGLKNSRSSRAKASGCSIAAK